MTLVFDCVSCAGCGCVLTVLAYLRTCLLTGNCYYSLRCIRLYALCPFCAWHISLLPLALPLAHIFSLLLSLSLDMFCDIFSRVACSSHNWLRMVLVDPREDLHFSFCAAAASSSIPRRSLASHISRSPETSPPFVMVSAANGAASDEAEVCCCAAGEVRRAAAQGLHGPVPVRLASGEVLSI